MTNEITAEQKQEHLEDLFDLFAVDKKRATGGVPMTLGGTTFMIAKEGNMRYAAATAKAFAELLDGPFKDKESRNGDAWEEATADVARNAMVKHIIVGWDKLKLNGKVYEGWSEEGAALLAQLDDLLDVIAAFSRNRKNYAPVITKEDEKN